MSRGSARGGSVHEARALLLGRVDFGEADLVITLFTDALGRVSALARGARRSRRRFAGALEPMHTLRVQLRERPGSDMFLLEDASLDRVRPRLTSHLGALEAAGRALVWLRKTASIYASEPQVWASLEAFLDELERAPEPAAARQAELGFRLLDVFGWGLELTRCVRCGKPCPAGQAAFVSPERGGLVCRQCGGSALLVDGALRSSLIEASQGALGVVRDEDAARALQIVDRALGAHLGVA